MTPAERRWNVLPPRGCHFRDGGFVPQGSAISPGVEENDAVQHHRPPARADPTPWPGHGLRMAAALEDGGC